MGGFLLIIQSSHGLEQVQSRITEVLKSSGGAADVLNYVVSARGKGLRPSLVFLTFDLCGGTRFGEAVDCATGVELVHMASLIHDDIIDGSELRRGRATVYRKFGTQVAVLAGDHLFAAAFNLFALCKENRVSQVMTRVIQEMCAGEINQLLSPAATESDYLDYIHKKTACLIGGCCRLGAILAGVEQREGDRLQALGENIGLAFQLTDDVLDYRGVGSVMGKDGGRDFAERLWTLPTIRAFGRGLIPGNWFLSDFDSIRFILEKRGILNEVWQLAASYIQMAADVLDHYPDSASKRGLESLLTQLVNRRS